MVNIMVTIGPSSLNEDDIIKFSKITKLFRLNGSHSDIEWHFQAVELIRGLCPEAFILMDIPGIKPRTANPSTVKIDRGQVVSFGQLPPDAATVHVDLTKPLPIYDRSIENFSLNDGQFSFNVTGTGDGFIVGQACEPFELLPRKGINLPGSIYDNEQQLAVYENFLDSVNHLRIDALGLSFVQDHEVVQRLRNIRPDLVLISKIENSEGLKNCAAIAEVSDAIMIDRGDLVAEIGFEKLFAGIETISKLTKLAGKPLIMATENLESMINRELPSKSEVVSLAHSASIGVDCFMLSEETAMSNNKQAIVNWLSGFLDKVTLEKNDITVLGPVMDGYKSDIWKSLQNFSDFPALVMSKSGRAVSKYFAHNPSTDLVVITDSDKLINSLKLYRNNILAFKTVIGEKPNFSTINDIVTKNANIIFCKHEKLLCIYVSQYSKMPRANTITIFQKEDFEDK